MADRTPRELKMAVFDYLRGDLDRAGVAEIEEQMIASAEFADYVERLQAVMQGAKKAEAEELDSLDRDAIFESIEARLVDDGPPVVVEHFDLPEEEVVVEGSPAWWRPLAAAAALALIFGAVYLVASDENRTGPVSAARNLEKVPLQEQKDDVFERSPEPRMWGTLEQRETEVESVTVFADDATNFEMMGQGARRTINLERGTVLVEFVPDEVEELTVRASEFEVRVIGTVFYASRDEARVGVVNGRVEVESSSGVVVELSSGEEWSAAAGVRTMPAEPRARAMKVVDIDEHIDSLARAETRRVARRKQAAPPVHTDREPPTPAETLSRRTEARTAIERGDHAEAARILESVLAELPSGDRAAGSIRLDLARIYINSLNRPQRATVHLRRFVKTRPNDAATPSARRELCRLAEGLGREEPECVD